MEIVLIREAIKQVSLTLILYVMTIRVQLDCKLQTFLDIEVLSQSIETSNEKYRAWET